MYTMRLDRWESGSGAPINFGDTVSYLHEAEIIVYSMWTEDIFDIIESVKTELAISKEYAEELVSGILEEGSLEELDFSYEE